MIIPDRKNSFCPDFYILYPKYIHITDNKLVHNIDSDFFQKNA